MKTQGKLGTHNSMTYLKPTGDGFMQLAWPFAKCQNLTYQQQYEFGVRLFDLRIRFHNNTPFFAHGFVEFFSVTAYEVLDYLEEKEDCVVNLVLENSSAIKDSQNDDFKKLCIFCEEKYKNTQFIGGWAKYPDPDPHPQVYTFKGPGLRRVESYARFNDLNQMMDGIQKGNSVNFHNLLKSLGEFVKGPISAAQLNNEKYWKTWLEDPKDGLMIDFVEIGAPESWREEHPVTTK